MRGKAGVTAAVMVVVTELAATFLLIIVSIQQEARDFEQKCHQAGGEVYSPDTGSRYDTAMCIDQDGRVINV